MNRSDPVESIVRLFAERGNSEYHGEAVSQLEHALQCADLAERNGAISETIVAALLHDIGHLLQGHGEAAAERGVDDHHENLGWRYLKNYFGLAVSEPVRLHVPAKRYLCAIDAEYRKQLSPASTLSLQLQGGPMSPIEVSAFAAEPFHAAAIALRHWDDEAKIPNLPTPDFAHFRNYLEAVRV